MKKNIVYILCLLFSLTCFTVNVEAKEDFPQLRSQNAIVINVKDDRILYQKNSDDKIYPASMTKIMTTLVAIENNKDMNQTYTFDDSFFSKLREENASVAGFKNGQTVTMKDLLYGILLPSGADATLAIADLLFGSEEIFVDKMNEKAQAMNLKGTHFMNTSGLHHENHYSTVRDMAKILKVSLKNELFKEIFMTKKYLTSDKSLTSYSTLVRQEELVAMDTSMIIGSKTGFTNEASLCLTSLAQFDEEQYIMVSAQTNSDSSYPYHIEDAARMYTYLNNYYERRKVVKKGEIIKKLKNSDTQEELYIVKSKEDVYALLPKGSEVKSLWEGVSEIKTPKYTDTYIGTYQIKAGDTVVVSQDYFLEYNIEETSLKSNFLDFMGEHLMLFVVFVVGMFGTIIYYSIYMKK